MEILCADCGCRVDAGVRTAVCADPVCCCKDLPIRETPDALTGGQPDPAPEA